MHINEPNTNNNTDLQSAFVNEHKDIVTRGKPCATSIQMVTNMFVY
jgi:hypothetical protein